MVSKFFAQRSTLKRRPINRMLMATTMGNIMIRYLFRANQIPPLKTSGFIEITQVHFINPKYVCWCSFGIQTHPFLSWSLIKCPSHVSVCRMRRARTATSHDGSFMVCGLPVISFSFIWEIKPLDHWLGWFQQGQDWKRKMWLLNPTNSLVKHALLPPVIMFGFCYSSKLLYVFQNLSVNPSISNHHLWFLKVSFSPAQNVMIPQPYWDLQSAEPSTSVLLPALSTSQPSALILDATVGH